MKDAMDAKGRPSEPPVAVAGGRGLGDLEGAIADRLSEAVFVITPDGLILSSSKHLLRLINDVLDLARAEAGKMEFHPQTVDLGQIADEVNGPLKSLAIQRKIQLEVAVDPSLREVTVDPGRLKQVLYNYVSNALKFTPEEGRVTVRIRPEGKDAFRIEVEDTGIGIRPEDINRLFVEFEQLDTTTSKKYQGTGLSLAFTKKIVEGQGGRVGVRSRPGQGSVFHAILPRDSMGGRGSGNARREVR